MLHADPEVGAARLEKLDEAMDFHNVKNHDEKGISLATEMIGLGCQLSNDPVSVSPEPAKALKVARGALDLCGRRCASPQGLDAFLGLGQWFCLLERAGFSVFDECYVFET